MSNNLVGRVWWTVRRLMSFVTPSQCSRMFEISRRLDTTSIRVEPARRIRVLNSVVSMATARPADGPIWAVTMVKNEEDIIEEMIMNLLSEGIDHVLVADNGSTDRTRAIVRGLSSHLPVHLVVDPITQFWQAEKISHLARAATRMGASWIVPADADELWRGEDGRSIADVLHASTADVVEASWWNYVPITTNEATAYASRFPYREVAAHAQVKVAFRANWLARVTHGNHNVTVPGSQRSPGLRIAHYRFRSPSQVLQKAGDGAASMRSAGWRNPQWSRLDGSTQQAAAELILRLTSSETLVYDPSADW